MTAKNNFQGPFAIGFTAGLAAGALAVYFLATERGEEFLDEMGDLWEEAKPELVKQGVIEKTDETLGQAVKSFLIGVFTHKVQETLPTDQSATEKKRVRKNKLLFKGV
jgi:gas vesicle protein